MVAYLARPKCKLSLEGKLLGLHLLLASLFLVLHLLLADLHLSGHVSSPRGLLDHMPPDQFAGGTFSANQGSALVLSIGFGSRVGFTISGALEQSKRHTRPEG